MGEVVSINRRFEKAVERMLSRLSDEEKAALAKKLDKLTARLAHTNGERSDG